ncbi:YafY family transcriptional regulator [Rheinheimera mesophila]|uniref:YafY family transcriptional regulator n=1 Tax=Rheinheimera mesophila TaxID=1547515 RepID=A0A3P3QGR3_9GAMM|nr:YafY family protein [Rheinheimera mesophila]RRJ20356.1 YafY family transcriptional regulator [Rheinheimera mesophila]
MNRIDRLLALILFLQSRRTCTAEAMAEHFGLSVRTIYRDIAALGEAGVPILAEAGVGYSLMKGYLLPPVNFSEQEAYALSTGVMLAQRMTTHSYNEKMQSALDKIKAVLPNEAKHRLELLAKGMATPTTEHPQQADLSVLQQAIARQQLLTFDYQSASQTQSSRAVEAAGLVFYLGRWHLIAWCRLRQAFRDFRTDRIHNVQLQREQFQARTDFNAKDFLQNSTPTAQLSAQISFMPAAADRARREWWQGIADEHQQSEAVVMTLNCTDWGSLACWLLSLGTAARVLAPDQLKQELCRQSQAILRLYCAS